MRQFIYKIIDRFFFNSVEKMNIIRPKAFFKNFMEFRSHFYYEYYLKIVILFGQWI